MSKHDISIAQAGIFIGLSAFALCTHVRVNDLEKRVLLLEQKLTTPTCDWVAEMLRLKEGDKNAAR